MSFSDTVQAAKKDEIAVVDFVLFNPGTVEDFLTHWSRNAPKSAPKQVRTPFDLPEPIDQCVHVELNASTGFSAVRCEGWASRDRANGFLCSYHQMSLDKAIQEKAQAAKRDLHDEQVQGIIGHEQRNLRTAVRFPVRLTSKGAFITYDLQEV